MEHADKRKQITKRLLLGVLLAVTAWAVYAQWVSPSVRALAAHARTPVRLVALTKPALFISYIPADKKASVRQISEKKPPQDPVKRMEQILKTDGLSPHEVKYFIPKEKDQNAFWQHFKHALSSWRYNPLLAVRFVYGYLNARHEKRTNLSLAEFILYALELTRLEITDFSFQAPPKKQSARLHADAPPPAVPDRAPLAVENRPIVVEVLNGSGKKGAALELTQYLRDQNEKGLLRVDVLQYDNYPGGSVEKTQITDYSGRLMQVKQLSTAIGCQQEILSEPRGNAICDTRIVIGKDFQMPL